MSQPPTPPTQLWINYSKDADHEQLEALHLNLKRTIRGYKASITPAQEVAWTVCYNATEEAIIRLEG